MSNTAKAKPSSALNKMRNQAQSDAINVMENVEFKNALSDMVNALMNMSAEERVLASQLVQENVSALASVK